MKLNFSKVTVNDIENNSHIVDISKSLGQVIYENAFLDEEMQIGKDIYFKKEIEINKQKADAIKKYLPALHAYVRESMIKILDNATEIIENVKK